MRNRNFSEFTGKNVQIILYRNHVFHTFTGKVIDFNRKQLCILTNFGSKKWISKPIFYRDSIKEIHSLEVIKT